ncbi:MAG: hypothetical protein J7501_14155 [Bdellovibrio sp.]|nr:hypothetical protein [Bdellovibrio sp.]
MTHIKRTIVTASIIAATLSAQVVQAGTINLGGRGYVVSYAALASGAVSVGIAYMPIHGDAVQWGSQATAQTMYYFAGYALIGLGALGIVGNIVSDTLSKSPDEVAMIQAQHRDVVRQSDKVLAGKASNTNQNFDALLSLFECGTCSSDTEKSVRLAKLISKSNQLGNEIVGKKMLESEGIDAKIDQSIKAFLGEDATEKNVDLARFVVAQAIVNNAKAK